MSWAEFQVDVDCPHCGQNQSSHAEFQMDEADECGVKSRVMEERCDNCECDKKFWFRSYIDFSIDCEQTWKRKPKE